MKSTDNTGKNSKKCIKKLNKYYGESEIKRRDWKGESNQRS